MIRALFRRPGALAVRRSLLSCCLPVLCLAAACSSDSGLGTACGGLDKAHSCVDLLNFNVVNVNILRADAGATPDSTNLVPGATNTGTALNPGKNSTQLTSSSVGTSAVFDAYFSGAKTGSVTCVVSSGAWVSVNPAVVFQQTGQLTCSDW